jgi:hypothetical protein
MNDLVVPIGRHVFLRRRLAVGLHHDDSAAKNLLVEPECLGALAVEVQIRTQFHGFPFPLFNAWSNRRQLDRQSRHIILPGVAGT